ncbi:GLPGLI family protein [uncultured Polaribacter sp.]|uniref:GLPGLI family protein n=1 Tax=uncultured Polaribacter sp. TaxID=174711 RepID=UPI002616DABB|nr:GLPGLI family protein [uncultured Polaribacter sp.]
MKPIFTILLFCFSVSITSQNISGKVIYESTINSKELVKYLTKSRNNLKNIKVKESLDKVYQNTSSIKSILTFSNNQGIFKVEESLNSDKDNILAQKNLKTVSGGSKEYYYNNIDKRYLIKDCETLGECFIFENTFLEWELTQEKRNINGFLCYKATRNKGKVIAWYTTSIPIGFGPKGEYGLPGLILELEIGRIIFKATKIKLNPKEEIIVTEPKEGKRVSKEEYKKIIDKSKKRVFGNK